MSRFAILRKQGWWAVIVLIALGALAYALTFKEVGAHSMQIQLATDLDQDRRLTFHMHTWDLRQAVWAYSELTGRELIPKNADLGRSLDRLMGGRLSGWRLISPAPKADSGVAYHADGRLTAAELKSELEQAFATNGLYPVVVGAECWRLTKATSGSYAAPNRQMSLARP